MKTAAWPREQTEAERLLVVDPAAGTMADFAVRDLPARLRAGDLLVVNDAATLPASLQAHATDGAPVEVRLLGPAEGDRWTAAVLGAGNWRWRTEDRPAPPSLPVGSVLTFGAAASDSSPPLRATVVALSDVSPRLVRLAFDRQGTRSGPPYRRGRPVQYSYVRAPLALWHVQTAYALRPAAEAPSGGPALTWRAARSEAARHRPGRDHARRGPLLDGRAARSTPRFRFPERFDIPAETVAAVARACRAGPCHRRGDYGRPRWKGRRKQTEATWRRVRAARACASIATSTRASSTACSLACTSPGRATSISSRPSRRSRSCGALAHAEHEGYPRTSSAILVDPAAL